MSASHEDLVAQGRRSLFCGEVSQAVESLQKACELIAAEYGDLDEKLAEPNFLYGSALLELARMESTVIGNALVGVPEDENASDSDELVEEGPEMTTEEKEELSNQVIDAMCEPVDNDANPDEVGSSEDKEDDKPQEDQNVDPEEDNDEKDETEENDENDSQDEQPDKDAEVDEDADDVTNLQLAWEVLEVSKAIYSRKDSKENKLKVADCLEKLAEISREKEDFSHAITDLEECLHIRRSVLDEDHRLIAEAHYQLGTTHAIAGSLELASTSFKNAMACLQTHLDNMKKRITEIETLDDHTEEIDALRSSVKDIESFLPDVQRRCAEIEEDISAAKAGGETSNCTSAIKNAAADNDEKPADDISHLIRKKRPTESNEKTCSTENGTPQLKKAKVGTNDTEVNGTHPNGDTVLENTAQNHATTEVA